MLTVLHIENIAVIEQCDIEFSSGFNVLTGETGAGKSIVIDSIGAIVGERITRDIVRTGAKKALVSAMFHDLPASVYTWLEENSFSNDEDDSLFIQRDISADGKNICRVNGRPITVTMLKTLGAMLINIHGQHDSQQLLNSEMHAMFIDRFAATRKYTGVIGRYRSLYEKLQELQAEKDGLVTDEAEKLRRMEMLRYQIVELEEADLTPGEEEEIAERRTFLRNSTKIISAIEIVLSLFDGDDNRAGICGDLGGAERALYQIPAEMERISAIAERVADLKYSTEDVSSELRELLNSFDISPDEIERIEERYDKIRKLSRKYGGTIEEILAYLDHAREELAAIEFSDQRAQELDQEIAQCTEEAWCIAKELFELRREAAQVFESRVLMELSQLDMAKVRFSASVTMRDSLTLRGCDNVEFLIATNAGEPLKPLSKIASGGELARIMLALKNVLAENDEVFTLVFDEVDAGVSGRAAQKVAEKLAELSRCKQILCVTHLSQMSAMADTHFKIEKADEGGRTFTSVSRLHEEGRIEEVARIIGGQTITQTTRDNARELLLSAQQIKKEF